MTTTVSYFDELIHRDVYPAIDDDREVPLGCCQKHTFEAIRAEIVRYSCVCNVFWKRDSGISHFDELIH